MQNRLLAGACAALLLAACAAAPKPAPEAIQSAPPASASAPVSVVRDVAEAWESEVSPGEELDSLAAWTTPEGDTWVIASAKSSHRLVVYDGDTGARLRTVGGQGAEPGRFKRPNGLAVFGDRLFVVERDNHRVQVLALPGFEALGSFGDDDLRSPYGIWLDETEPGELQAYVTDSFMYGERYDVVPPLHELAQRVRRFRVQFDQDGRLRARYTGAFGDTREEYALRRVESIGGDPANDRLLVADEDREGHAGGRGSTLREYTLAGRFTGRSLPAGSFAAEAEGVALWDCPGGGGYWVAVDQLAPLTRFHLFERRSLAPSGTFQGLRTAFTDGIALHGATTRRFPGGALYAVNDDASVAAFDLRDVAAALGLDQACL
ncbi:NHL repeat-containing protein [Cognatiluteimonas lumbrici]|uniref:phytase n=1 Tax=Cognatiluteimonas lumbrici TaxID=2559601 RepID=UPI00112A1026|nr:phytase [Luteimonas lumbrici]